MIMTAGEYERGDDELEDEEKEDAQADENAEPDPDLVAEDGDDDEDGKMKKKKSVTKARKRGETDALDAGDLEALNEPLEQPFDCPHCGEPISVILDPDGAENGMEINEDCEVCCRPMEISYRIEDALVVEFSVEAV